MIKEDWDDDARTYISWDAGGVQTSQLTYAEKSLDDGYPATFYDEVADNRIATLAQLADHEARLKRIETKLWPPPPDPTSSTDPSVLDWAGLGGVWPDGGLVKDGGKVWRNVSGVPLTTAPTAFPGTASQWTHLFVEVTITPPPPTGTAWAAGVAYKVDDLVTYGGFTYKCIQAHTSQVGWEPPNVASLWAKQ